MPEVGRHEAARQLFHARQVEARNNELIESLVTRLHKKDAEIARLSRERDEKDAALDALTAAAKPIEEAVREDDADWQRHEGGARASYYTLAGANVRALLDCITTLTRGSHA